MAVSISSRTKLIAAMGIIVVAAAGVTLATFTDSGTVETTFTAGTLDLKFDDDQDGTPENYVVDFSAGFDNLAPGDTVTRELLIYNSGTIGALVDLATPTITNSAGSPAPALQDSLMVTITDVATVTELYSGPLTAAAFTGLDIGAGGPANGRTLRIDVTLDAAAPVGVAGQSVHVVLPFTAAQA